MHKLRSLSFFLFALPLLADAQPGFRRDTSIQVFDAVNTRLRNAWAGGHNFTEISDIDLDMDGIKDLVVYDKTANNPWDKITTYINLGTPNQVSYIHAPQYEKKFPVVHDWMLLVDYNCDGKEDIFTYSVGAFSVYRNTSTVNNLQFTLAAADVYTTYLVNNSYLKLYVSPVDVPAFVDVDNDGDLDVLTYDGSGTQVEMHKNLSMETYGSCDSLYFKQTCKCWGHFTEDITTNVIQLNSCVGPVIGDVNNAGRPLDPHSQSGHAGSCLVCLDMDADGDKDAIIGDLSYCNLNMVTNGGNADTANMVLDDPNFSTSDVTVNQVLFPCPYHLDVNNDGKRDLLVAPNAPTVSENITSIIYYKNNGTDLAPVFNFQQNDFLQGEMVDLGEGAFPVLFDFDADGLTDLLVGNGDARIGPGCSGTEKSSITAYRNIGTPTNPKFKFITSDFAGIRTALLGDRFFTPAFGDLDGDGDEDMVVGDEDGEIHCFMDTSGISNPPSFAQQMPYSMMDINNVVIDVGAFAAPQLFDIDQDGKLDLIVGRKNGFIAYYRNTGTVSSPVFTLITSTLGNVDTQPQQCCNGFNIPFLFIDSGNIEMFVGSEQGYIYHYDNIIGNLGGTFAKLDSMLWAPSEVWEGMRCAPTFKDVTNDGLLDMVVGNFRGGLAFYAGDLSVGMHSTAYSSDADMELYPNPAGDILHVKFINVLSESEFRMYNTLGEEVLSERLHVMNTGVDVSRLSTGIYICMVKAGDKQVVKKVVIER
jgi:hypothetical protein